MSARSMVPGPSEPRTFSLREHPVAIPAGLLLLGALFLLAAALATMLLRQAWLGFEHEHWKAAPGVVTESQLLPASGTDDSPQRDRVEFRYRFTVHGRSYEGVAFSLREPPPARAIIQKYPVGRRVTVHYDPRFPGDAVLKLDRIGSRPLLLGFGFFAAVALGSGAALLGILRRLSAD
jgi:hypothetical protein